MCLRRGECTHTLPVNEGHVYVGGVCLCTCLYSSLGRVPLHEATEVVDCRALFISEGLPCTLGQHLLQAPFKLLLLPSTLESLL